MGHKSEDTFLSYLSDTSGLNVQDMVNGRQPDHRLMESLQSMALGYRTAADSPSPEDDNLDTGTTSFLEGVVRPAQSKAMRLILDRDRLREEAVDLLYSSESSTDFNLTVSILAKMASTGPRSALVYQGVQPMQGRRCPYCKADIWKPWVYQSGNN